jgi:hypothetical protein
MNDHHGLTGVLSWNGRQMLLSLNKTGIFQEWFSMTAWWIGFDTDGKDGIDP